MSCGTHTALTAKWYRKRPDGFVQRRTTPEPITSQKGADVCYKSIHEDFLVYENNIEFIHAMRFRDIYSNALWSIYT